VRASAREAEMVAAAFDRRDSVRGSNLSESQITPDDLNAAAMRGQS